MADSKYRIRQAGMYILLCKIKCNHEKTDLYEDYLVPIARVGMRATFARKNTWSAKMVEKFRTLFALEEAYWYGGTRVRCIFGVKNSDVLCFGPITKANWKILHEYECDDIEAMMDDGDWTDECFVSASVVVHNDKKRSRDIIDWKCMRVNTVDFTEDEEEEERNKKKDTESGGTPGSKKKDKTAANGKPKKQKTIKDFFSIKHY